MKKIFLGKKCLGVSSDLKNAVNCWQFKIND